MPQSHKRKPKQKPAPLGKPPSAKNILFSMPGKILTGILTFCTLLGVIVLWPRMTVDPEGYSDPSQSSFLSFRLTNTGTITLTNVQPVLYPCSVRFRHPKNPPSDSRGHPTCNGPFKDGFSPPTWHTKALSMDEKQTLRFDDYVNQLGLIIEYADVAIGIKYQPWILPWTSEKQFRFVTRKEPDGKLSWISVPINK